MVLFEHEGLWGYKDDNGTIVIEPQFVKARNFKNGFAVVAIDYKTKHPYGQASYKTPKLFYIDETGRDIFQQTFEEASDFTDKGYAWALKNSWVKSEIVMLPSMRTIHHRGEQKKFHFLSNGWIYIHSCWGISAKSIGGTTYLFDQNGKALIEQDCSSAFGSDPDDPSPAFFVGDFLDGLLKIHFDSDIVFVDENFNTILTIPKDQYKYVGDFNRGKAKVEIWKEKITFFDINKLSTKTVIGISSESKHKELLLIDEVYYDKLGNKISPATIEDQSNAPKFIGNRAIVNSYHKDEGTDRWVYVNIINKQGEIIVPNVEYYHSGGGHDRWACLHTQMCHSNNWSQNSLLIHPNSFISEIKYINDSFKHSTLFVYNEIGQIIFSESTAYPIGVYSDGFLLIVKSTYNKYGNVSKEYFFIDEEGNKHTIQGRTYEYHPFVNGFAKIKEPYYVENSKGYNIGYINTNFEVVIPMQYKQHHDCVKGPFTCHNFSCNLAKIHYSNRDDGRKIFFINTKGEKVLDLSQYDDSGSFYNNVTYVRLKGGYTDYYRVYRNNYKIIDLYGNNIIDLIPGNLFISDEFSIIFHSTLYGFIDKTGELIIEPNLENVEEFDDTGKCKVVKNGVIGYIDDNGNFSKHE